MKISGIINAASDIGNRRRESNTPAVRKKFKSLLTEEINIYDNFISYGFLKGWVFKPPSFKG